MMMLMTMMIIVMMMMPMLILIAVTYLFLSSRDGAFEDGPRDDLITPRCGEGALVAVEVADVVRHQLQQARRLGQQR